MLFLLWIVALLLVSVQAASLIAGERSHQTLDVLATTPISGREILLQKYGAVRRLMVVLSIPFGTIFFFEAWWRSSVGFPTWGRFREFSLLLYLFCSALSVAVYLPLAAWMSVLIGLVVRTQARAITSAVGAIAGLCIGPLVFIVMPLVILFHLPGNPDAGWTYLLLLSPAPIVPLAEFNELSEFVFPWLAVVMNFCWYGFMSLVLRQACLANADRFLGRAESQ
jgi:ABC-type transport system involved in multi-copper enzyme maturation permease subunit